jgi:hypothetical protein
MAAKSPDANFLLHHSNFNFVDPSQLHERHNLFNVTDEHITAVLVAIKCIIGHEQLGLRPENAYAHGITGNQGQVAVSQARTYKKLFGSD